MSTNEDHKNVAEPILPDEELAVNRDKRVRSIMMWTSIALAAIVIGSIAYIFGYRQPAIENGNEAIGVADSQLAAGNDSVALDLYQQIAADHGFAAGNRAALQSAILLYDKGEYQNALEYLEGYDASDDIVAACATALKGDCYANLDQLDKAEAAFAKAASLSGANKALVPYFLLKKAHVLEASQKWAEAAAVYGIIEREYAAFARQCGAEAARLRCEAL
ncbi:MAG: hypothetical protein K2H33_04780 [Muribaculaceae bacterium]|nr:hypothetical protein [Muribaculaceae bacterium]MDE6314950.1 hypothetical protein [Muribaculaceae bacterium]